MTNGDGFVRLRRGILEHLQDGRIRPMEFAAFLTILLAADHRNGAWQGSARSLARLMGLSRRYCQKLLARLEGRGYVTRGSPQPPGTYAIGVKRYFAGCAGVGTPVPGGRPPVVGVGTPVPGGRPPVVGGRHPGAHREQEGRMTTRKRVISGQVSQSYLKS